MAPEKEEKIFVGIRQNTIMMCVGILTLILTGLGFALHFLSKVNEVLVKIELNNNATHNLNKDIENERNDRLVDKKETTLRLDYLTQNTCKCSKNNR